MRPMSLMGLFYIPISHISPIGLIGHIYKC